MLASRPSPRSVLLALGALFLLLLGASVPAHAQLPDSSDATPDSIAARLNLPEGHSPRGALWRAAAAPGWGQYYNRQYLKMPVVYLALGGILTAAVYTWDRYLLYRNAWRFEQQPEEFPQYEDARASLEGVVDNFGSARILRTRRDRFRRWRDLSIIGSGLVYALQIVDAYVSAHLLGFEVGEDLSLNATPGRDGLTATFRVAL